MATAKRFENGRSQAVRLPKECHFWSDEVFVNKVGEIVMLIPKTSKWDGMRNSLDMFSEDFMQMDVAWRASRIRGIRSRRSADQRCA